jgi:tetratricopeptide (TPR) repeat protein
MICRKCLQHELEERDRLEWLITLVEALRSEGQFPEAERAIEEALRYVGTDKRYAEADKRVAQKLYLERGLIQRLSNRLAEARRTFEQVLVTVQADPVLRNEPNIWGRVYGHLATVLQETEEYREAAAAYEKALLSHPQDDPNHYRIVLWLGDCYLWTADYAKAQDCYTKVIASPYASEAEKTNARAGLAKLFYRLKEYAKAATMFEKILPHYDNDDPKYSNMLLVLGYCYEAMGADAKARECYEKVLASPHTSEDDKISARDGNLRLSSSSKPPTYQ